MFKIEKDVPMPKSRTSRSKYPFALMEVGDSILVGNDKEKNARSACWTYGSRTGKKFSAIKVDGGVRVWRVE